MKKEIHILMLEDSPADAEIAKHTLHRGGVHYSAVRVDNEKDFIRQIEENPPDLILSDYALPGFDGYAALEIAKKKCPETPFIFLTGTMGEEVAIETLKNGATDYVLKHRLARLVPSVHRALRESQERQERRRAERQLRESHEQLRALSVYLQRVREEERTRIAREVH
ncbi:MAG TPA: response regulator, partial [Verrucomicrobiae bacterium]|nr:response regulator [Verrucomicrobiae bacterium]